MAIIWDDENSQASGGIVWDDEQPNRSRSLLQKLFIPANVVREGVGGKITRDLSNLQSLLGATSLGQVARATTHPLNRALISRIPEDIGGAVGTLASLPFDPTTYAFGGIGAIPSRAARGVLGATAGGLAASAQSDGDVGATMLGAGLGGIGSAATRIGRGGIRLAPREQPTEARMISRMKPVEREATLLGKQRSIEDIKQAELQRIEQETSQSAASLQARKGKVEAAMLKRKRGIEDVDVKGKSRILPEIQAVRAKLDKETAEINQALQDLGHVKTLRIREKFHPLARKKSESYKGRIKAALEDTQGGSLPPAGDRISITKQKAFDYLSRRFPNNPEEVQTQLSRLFPEGTESINARNAYENIERLSGEISQKGKTGGGYSWRDKISDDTRSTLLDLIEQSDDLAGNPTLAKAIRESKAEWATWAPIRNKIIRLTRPFLKDAIETEQSGKFLVNAARSGQKGVRELIRILEDELQEDLTSEFKSLLSRMPDRDRIKMAAQVQRVAASGATRQAKRTAEDVGLRIAGRLAKRQEGIKAREVVGKESAQQRAIASKRALEDLKLDVAREIERKGRIVKALVKWGRGLAITSGAIGGLYVIGKATKGLTR